MGCPNDGEEARILGQGQGREGTGGTRESQGKGAGAGEVGQRTYRWSPKVHSPEDLVSPPHSRGFQSAEKGEARFDLSSRAGW